MSGSLFQSVHNSRFDCIIIIIIIIINNRLLRGNPITMATVPDAVSLVLLTLEHQVSQDCVMADTEMRIIVILEELNCYCTCYHVTWLCCFIINCLHWINKPLLHSHGTTMEGTPIISTCSRRGVIKAPPTRPLLFINTTRDLNNNKRIIVLPDLYINNKCTGVRIPRLLCFLFQTQPKHPVIHRVPRGTHSQP